MRKFPSPWSRPLALCGSLAAALAMAGCGSTNSYLAEKRQSTEYYRIFQIKTQADRLTVAAAASKGLSRNVNDIQEATPIPDGSEPPVRSGRFKLVSPLANTPLGMLAGGAGTVGFKVAQCDGAVWTARAQRHISGSNTVNVSACLWQHQGGYNLDLYAVFTKADGGLMQLSRNLAYAVVGTPEAWTEKTLLDVVREIQASAGAEVAYLEGQPKVQGTPWLDGLDRVGG